MIKKDISVLIYEAQNSLELDKTEQNLIHTSRKMTDNAYAPYSGFFVGAAVLLENGEVITGSNQENGAYPSGLCAERVAVFAASARYPGVAMKMIAVSARSSHVEIQEPVSPCGACRQALLEYEVRQKEPIKVLLSKENGKIIIVEKVKDLLPLFFSGDNLRKK